MVKNYDSFISTVPSIRHCPVTKMLKVTWPFKFFLDISNQRFLPTELRLALHKSQFNLHNKNLIKVLKFFN